MKILLFDVDLTLTPARSKIQPQMVSFLKQISKQHIIAIVSGSDYNKVIQQIGQVCEFAQWIFSQNGLKTYKKNKIFHQRQLKDQLGQENLKRFIKFTLRMISDLQIPIMRGTFIQYRTGMINISPIGRNCSKQQRNQFQKYDHAHQIRKSMIQKLKKQFPDLELQYSIGGQISFDVFPKGFDKTYCLKFLQGFQGDIHFFGDKTYPGGNDFQIYEHQRTIGHSVTGPDQTLLKLRQLLNI